MFWRHSFLSPTNHKTHQDTLCKEELFSRPDQLSNSQTQFLLQFDSICRFFVAVAFVIDVGGGCVESCWVFVFDFESGRRILCMFWGGHTI